MKLGRRAFCRSGAAALAIGLAPRIAAATRPEPRGVYSGGGHLAAIGGFDDFGDGNYLFDYSGLRAGRLSGSGSVQTMLSTFDESGSPVARIETSGDGLRIGDAELSRMTVRRQPFAVASGGITLAGETACLSDREPQGTILLVYGSGPGPREGLEFWRDYFIAEGWLVASYDKRGSGASDGDWRNASLETLAEDAAGVIERVRGQAGSLPLGVWAISQGGWIAPQLGARGLADFLILHAGAAVTPAEQIVGQVVAELAAYGFDPVEIETATAYYALDIDVSRGARPWSDIQDAYQTAAGRNAEWLLAPPAPANSPERETIRLLADFDPSPYWRRSHIPVLAIFGGKDVIVPPEPNHSLLTRYIGDSARLTTSVLAEANHLGFIADTGVRAEYAAQTSIDPGYFPTIQGWLSALSSG